MMLVSFFFFSFPASGQAPWLGEAREAKNASL